MVVRPNTFPNNLPFQLTRFIGREQAIADIRHLVVGEAFPNPVTTQTSRSERGERARLVTLTGVGGCGKTRLALEVAYKLSDDKDTATLLFSDGIWFTALGAISNPALVPQVMAALLKLPQTSNLTPTETLIQALRLKKVLLILDNCEHLLTACAQLSETLLQACPDITILATSRAALKVSGEVIFPVPPLTTLNPDQPWFITDLVQCESIRLFIDRARAVQPHFALTAGQGRAVTQICQCLDGIPLAIELAAARVKTLTPQQIADRLGDMFHLLRSTSPTAFPRHQNLHLAFDWSHNLLAETEQVLFRRLSVFTDGWTLEAAEQVAGDEPLTTQGLLDLHEGLLQQSLITRMDDGHGERARYRMLAPVRQYAMEKLQAAGETAACRKRHLAWCVALAEEAEPKIVRGGQGAWLARIEEELANIRAGLDQTLETQTPEKGLRLAAALWPFWEMQSLLSEGRKWLEQLLAQADRPGEQTRAQPIQCQSKMKALLAVGVLCWQQDRYDLARQYLEACITLAQETGADWYYAYGLCRLGRVLRVLGHLDEAQDCFEQSLALFRQLDDAWGISRPLRDLGLSALRLDRNDEARAYLEEALAIRRAINDLDGIADALEVLGTIHVLQGDYTQAENYYQEALQRYHAIGYRQGLAAIYNHLGYLAQRRGNLAQATQFFQQSIPLSDEIGATRDLANAIIGLQSIVVAQGDSKQGARLEGLLETLARPQDQLASPEYQPLHEQAIAAASAVLGSEALAELKTQGRTMTLEAALAHTPEPPSQSPTHSTGLTTREVEVLRLVAVGLSNQEVADQLIISRRTVHAHLRSIFGKLEVTTRTAAAREAARLKLI